MRCAVVSAVALLLAAGGCDLRPKVSQQKLETALEQWLVEHDLEAKDIHCPDNQVMENGNVFECTCNVHGTDIPVKVEVTDATKGTVEWKPKYLTVKGETFAAELRENPKFAKHDIEVTCTDKVLVSIPDSEWACQIVDHDDGDKKYSATVKFKDGQGQHSIDSEPM